MFSLFPLGTVEMSDNVSLLIRCNPRFQEDIMKAFRAYRNGDWGVTNREDKLSNNFAVKSGNDRISAMYQTCEGKIWIVTEWEHICTTISFSNGY